MTDELSGRRSERERDRLRAVGKRTDNGRQATLLLVHENDFSWTIHGLGAPGVTLSAADMITLAEQVLLRAQAVDR